MLLIYRRRTHICHRDLLTKKHDLRQKLETECLSSTAIWLGMMSAQAGCTVNTELTYMTTEHLAWMGAILDNRFFGNYSLSDTIFSDFEVSKDPLCKWLLAKHKFYQAHN